MLAALPNSSIPPIAWRYTKMVELNPARDEENLGTIPEFRKLVESISRYYREAGQRFNTRILENDFKLFTSIMGSK
jgi:hypothetical protein